MPMPVAPSMGGRDWGLLVALSVLWGGSFFFIGVAVQGLPPLTIVALRVTGAALVLWLWLGIRGRPVPWTPSVWGACVIMGLTNNVVPFSLIVWGQTQIGSGLASILNAMTPLFTVIVAHLWTRDEKMGRGKLAGVCLGLAGVVVLIGPSALRGLGEAVLAQLAVLAACVSYAVAGVFGRRFRDMGVTPVQTAAGQVTASALVMTPLAMVIEAPWTLPVAAVQVWLAIGGLAVVSTAVAYGLYFRILAAAGASNLLLVTFLIPATAILLGVLVLGETLVFRQVAGLGVIALGLIAMDGRPVRWLVNGRIARTTLDLIRALAR